MVMLMCSILFNTFLFTHLLSVLHVHAINIKKKRKHRDKRIIKKTSGTGFINRLVSIGTHKIVHKHNILGNRFPCIYIYIYKVVYVTHLLVHNRHPYILKYKNTASICFIRTHKNQYRLYL